MAFKVGDRVKVYEGRNIFAGTVSGFEKDGLLSVRGDGDDGDSRAHPKQCRKLKWREPNRDFGEHIGPLQAYRCFMYHYEQPNGPWIGVGQVIYCSRDQLKPDSGAWERVPRMDVE